MQQLKAALSIWIGLLISFILCVVTLASLSVAASTISYQGRITTNTGESVADGIYTVRFRLYSDSTGGTIVWEETVPVQAKGGLFTTSLGATTAITSSKLADTSLFLAMRINLDPEIPTRTRLQAVPYAWRIKTIDGAAGGAISGDVSVAGQISSSATTGKAAVFTASQADTGAYAVVATNPAIGAIHTSALLCTAKPQDGYGFGAKFEAGFIGAHGLVRPTGFGTYYGLYGRADGAGSQEGAELYGVTGFASGSYKAWGVLGYASGYTWEGAGVRGIGINGTGILAEGTGTYGTGIYATGAGHAGYFNGPVYVQGFLGKEGGAFKIDHPLDPENKYLQHSFVESPDMMNVYNGIAVLDDSGEAVIEMPEWFEALNRDFRYQLTCIGGFAPVYILSEVTDNQFRIAGGTPGLRVSWQVTGIRHDPWAEHNRIQVEVRKPSDKVGTYLFPTGFAKGLERQEGYERIRALEESRLRIKADEAIAEKN